MKKLIICDLDNTLYDWVGYFVPSLYAMVDEAVRILGVDREVLLDDLQKVHRRHHDSEHPFSLMETSAVRTSYPKLSRRELAVNLDEAFHAFNSKRVETLVLYDGVREGLDALINCDVKIVAHTESKLFSAVDRIRRLGITDYFSHIYCRERSSSEHVSEEATTRWLKSFPMDRVQELSLHQRKPNPEVLREICNREGVRVEEALYVGDSMARDITMAKSTGVFAAWAKYGTDHSPQDYEALVRISHWTDEDVAREATLKMNAEGVQPDAILNKSFKEVLKYLN